jgi:ribonuclease HI
VAKGQKYYVVWKGRQTGIFDSWEACSAQVTGFVGAEYKAFERRDLAERALAGQYADYRGKGTPKARQARLIGTGGPILPSYAVDAACSGNPGLLEYQCVDVQTGQRVFHRGPFANGTNNIGEFLALVHALVTFNERGIHLPIYSDSVDAIGWLKIKKCRTRLVRDDRNTELFDLIASAERWLAANRYENRVLKWETTAWGENPADFGRK